MTAGQLSEPDYLLQGTTASLLKLSACSACTIATLLCVPDGIGILPDAPSVIVWCIRVFGLWLSAWVLWFIGFSALVLGAGSITRGIELNGDGCKLWRWGKFIPWDCVQAIVSEPQPLFSRAFCLRTPVYKLTLYCRRGTGKRARIEAENVASIQLSRSQYESLLAYAAQHSLELIPHSAEVALVHRQAVRQVKRSYEQAQRLKVGLTCLIVLSLSFYMVRKASLNYNYNEGMREFRLEHYRAAARSFEQAAKIDPTFASAWDSLARSEYRLGDGASAEKHWRKALSMKPDFVESKIGLANLLAKSGKLDDADRLLRNAIRLSPTNLAAYMNLADIHTRKGDLDSAGKTLQVVIKHDPDNLRARASLIRALTQQGKLQQAKVECEQATKLKPRLQSDADFLLLVQAELALANGDKQMAERFVCNLLPRFKNDPALIAVQAKIASSTDADATVVVNKGEDKHANN